MATDSSKLYVPAPPKAKGTFFRAPLGTALPTDPLAALTADYVDLGGVGEEGYVLSQSRDVQKKKDFGGKTVAILQPDYTETLQVTLIESTKLEVLKTVFGDGNVTFTPATPTKGAQIDVKHTADLLPQSVYIIDTIYGEGVKRQIVPIGQVTNVADVAQTHTDIVQYALTIELFGFVYEDDTIYMLEKMDDGKFVPAGGSGN